MFSRQLAVVVLVLIPAVASAQRGGRGGGGGMGGDKANYGDNRSSTSMLQLSNRDVEDMSPLRLLIDKRKDLKLADDRVKQLKDLEGKLKDKNDPSFKALDSLRRVMRPSSTQTDDERTRMMTARSGVMAAVADIRANYDASAKEALALLDETQQKTASDLLQKQTADAEQMLQEKLNSRGERNAGADSAATTGGRRRPPM
jgi:hypothetical protein